MPEYLNAEIAGGIVTDVATAGDWLSHSFYFIRVVVPEALRRRARHCGVQA